MPQLTKVLDLRSEGRFHRALASTIACSARSVEIQSASIETRASQGRPCHASTQTWLSFRATDAQLTWQTSLMAAKLRQLIRKWPHWFTARIIVWIKTGSWGISTSAQAAKTHSDVRLWALSTQLRCVALRNRHHLWRLASCVSLAKLMPTRPPLQTWLLTSLSSRTRHLARAPTAKSN